MPHHYRGQHTRGGRHSNDSACSRSGTIGFVVHIYSQDTDVLLLALCRVPELVSKTALIIGSGERRHKVMLKPIYEKLGSEKSAALINWHSLTGCDTTGHIQQKAKWGCFTAFLDARPAVVAAIADLGVGAELSAEVVRGCEEFLCVLFCPTSQRLMLSVAPLQSAEADWTAEAGSGSGQTTTYRWCVVGAHTTSTPAGKHLVSGPSAASYHCITPDPLTLGWRTESDRLLPVLSKEPPAPATRCGSAAC